LEKLTELLGVPVRRDASGRVTPGVDAWLSAGPVPFLLAWSSSSAPGKLLAAIHRLKRTAMEAGGGAIPLVAVPYMGQMGKRLCEESQVAWVDLSGNARIEAPGLKILVSGRPNLFKQRGRPSSPFAPKSSRIARWLLMHPGERFTQRKLARATGMDEGFTSRIVTRLEQDRLVARDERGSVFVPEPNLLLDAWVEDYDFSKHGILRGHVPVRSSEELLQRLDEALGSNSVEHAATGLAAAWQMTRFAAFRIVAIYLADEPSPFLIENLAFREEERGANVWLVVPKDEGVFHGSGIYRGIRCVHPVQVYLDLKSHPERAAEVAEHLRKELLKWGK